MVKVIRCLVGASCLSLGLAAPPVHSVAPWAELLQESRTARTSLAPGRVHDCLNRAARHFKLPSLLLRAIAQTESGGDPKAVNRANRNGSYDVGLMQINSSWLPTLAQWKVAEKDLYDPCISAYVGAWILADNMARLGPVWRAVGAYNARTPSLQLRYVKRVQKQLEILSRNQALTRNPAAAQLPAAQPPQATRTPDFRVRPEPSGASP